jgi:uncharacterized OsmC-like protein
LNLDILNSTIKNIKEHPCLAKCKFHVKNRWLEGNHNRTFIKGFYGAKQENQHQKTFELDTDEPPILSGHDQAPNPAEHLLIALATCLTTALVAHAAVRDIHLDEVESEIEGDIDLKGFLGISQNTPEGYTNIRIKFKVKTDEDKMEKTKSLSHFSPVYNMLINGVNVEHQVNPK